jgi:hypothetical protein
MSTTDTPSPSAMSAAREKIAELERALDFNLQGNRESVARIEQLEREPAAALATIAELQTLADNQAEDIERLLADKARLDWLEANGDELWCTENVAGNIEDYWIHPTRAAIDAARKEGQS